MKDQKKAKWILGTSGIVLSALLLTQFTDASGAGSSANELDFTNEQAENMSQREKELAQLDWTNFEIVGITQQPQTPIQSDRKTKRS